MPLPRVFFDFTIHGVPSGRVVFELYADICPKTCENFRCLCTGEKGEGKTTFKPLHYKGTPIHRIVKGFIVQGGDFSVGDGTGGESIYGGMFKDENFQLKHDQPFLLSMANKGPNTNGSQFFITTKPAVHLDGVHVVFGRVIQGEQFVVEIENQKVDTNHRPYSDVRISNCGELVLVKAGKASRSKRSKVKDSSSTETETSSSSDESSSESESESSEEERSKRKRRRKRKEERKEKRKRKKRRKRKRKDGKKGGKDQSKQRSKKRKQEESESDSDSDSESSEGELEDENVPPPDEAVTSTIAEEVLPPDVVSTSRSWLFRSSKSPSPKADSEKKKESARKQGSESSFKSRENQVSQSGRTLKGRGLMRYHTPPRFGGGFEDRALYAERRRWDQHYRRSRSRSRERPRRWRHSPSPTHRWKPQSLNRRHSSSPELRREKSRSRSPLRHESRKERGRHAHRPHSPDERHRKRQGARQRSASRERDAEHQPRREVSGVMKSDEDSEPTSEHRTRRSKQQDHERKSNSHSPSPDRRKREKRPGKHRYQRESDESGCSSPNRKKKSSKGRKHHRRSRSRSRTPQRYQKTSSYHRRHSKREKSSSSDSKPLTSSSLPSKWARHHDSTSSSSEEDRELEQAYQHGSRGRKTSDTEDVFGIAELSSKVLQ